MVSLSKWGGSEVQDQHSQPSEWLLGFPLRVWGFRDPSRTCASPTGVKVVGFVGVQPYLRSNTWAPGFRIGLWGFGVCGLQADLWFTLLSLGMISVNLRNPFLLSQPGFLLIMPALFCKALLMTLCVNW